MEKPAFYENSHGDVYDCDCCGYTAPLFKYNFTLQRQREVHMCEVCYSTFLSKCVEYPSQCADEKLHRSVGWIANRILSEINPNLYSRDQFETIVIQDEDTE